MVQRRNHRRDTHVSNSPRAVRWLKKTCVACVATTVLGGAAAIALASPALAWTVQGSATAVCDSSTGLVNINGIFNNNEGSKGINATMVAAPYGSDGPKVVAAGGNASFSVKTNVATVPSGSVVYKMTWAQGSGSDQRTVNYSGITCQKTPPPSTPQNHSVAALNCDSGMVSGQLLETGIPRNAANGGGVYTGTMFLSGPGGLSNTQVSVTAGALTYTFPSFTPPAGTTSANYTLSYPTASQGNDITIGVSWKACPVHTPSPTPTPTVTVTPTPTPTHTVTPTPTPTCTCTGTPTPTHKVTPPPTHTTVVVPPTDTEVVVPPTGGNFSGPPADTAVTFQSFTIHIGGMPAWETELLDGLIALGLVGAFTTGSVLALSGGRSTSRTPRESRKH